MNKKSILIIGAGGHAKVVSETAEMMNLKICAFLDEAPKSSSFLGAPLHSLSDAIKTKLYPASEYDAFVAIGNNQARRKWHETLTTLGYKFPILIHPSAVISKNCHIGEGSIILPNAVVNYDAHIGMGVIINSAAVVEHDCKVGDFAIVNQGAILQGGASIGENGIIEAGCVVKKMVQLPAATHYTTRQHEMNNDETML